MLQSFIIILREGFESFLLVAVILAYLRKSGRPQLTSAVYAAIAAGVTISAGLGYLLFKMQTGSSEMIERAVGPTFAGFLGNEALREGVLGVIAIVMVLSLVIYMWRTGPRLKQHMEGRLTRVSTRAGWLAFAGELNELNSCSDRSGDCELCVGAHVWGVQGQHDVRLGHTGFE